MAEADKNQKMVTINIDGVNYEVPEGMNVVDAAKWYAANDIPVFCYHPKMDPVGMCRMCIVEWGMPERDRATGETVRDADGNPKIRWHPKLQTACTQQAADGMAIKTDTEKVTQNREAVLEFLLTSHPLDCPICDKGGECPLQNLTMAHGPGTSRMNFSDKMKLDKHVPLGDLIFLDEERCIQCGRCVRFQDELVGDDVLGFHERGRSLQIITNSEPGFDTYFSGNTTDICPVGALTTADFRFGARPWELTEVPSIDPHGPEGSNISLSMRLDRDFGGRAMIKRVMPRQNEEVNEIWISDKARFGHHFTRSEARLMQPMLRQGDALQADEWGDVLQQLTEAIQAVEGDVAVIAGSGASNEDLWELRQLMTGLGVDETRLGAWPMQHAGAEYLAQVGVGQGTRLKDLGAGDAILVIASDLEEEAPLWRLQLKQAQDRGALLVVANARNTRMGEFAAQETRHLKPMKGADLRYEAGQAAHFMANFEKNAPEIADQLAQADNLIIVAGAEGLTPDGSRALMQACARFLLASDHVGKPNNGLLATLPGPNGMGLHYMGFTPENTQAIIEKPPKVLLLAQAEVLDDDPLAASWLDQVETLIAFSLFPDRAAQKATFALPIQSFAERDGTFTNAARRVQRFYTAQGPMGEAIPLWKAVASLRERLGQGRAKVSAAAVMLDITKNLPAFEGMRYKELARVPRQYPDVGGEDLYYGGTAYENTGGIGLQIPSEAERGKVTINKAKPPKALKAAKKDNAAFVVLPSTRLYNRQSVFKPSAIVHPRVLPPYVVLNADDADKLGVTAGDVVEIAFGDAGEHSVRVRVGLDATLTPGYAVLPRHMSATPTPATPTEATISQVTEAEPV